MNLWVKYLLMLYLNISYFCSKFILKMMELKIIQCFSQVIGILKTLLLAIIFKQGNVKDYIMKVVNPLLHLNIVLFQR